MTSQDKTRESGPAFSAQDLEYLEALEKKILWLSTYMIHYANHLRKKKDTLKVGGHQASSASLATIMTALYLHVLQPEDRVAVKPHASPIFHAVQYLLGQQDLDQLKKFRAFGGAQSYPSRTKDIDDVDFSTGSVGLGVAMSLFSSLVQDYLYEKQIWPKGKEMGRMIALVGDAELDEGNIFEALLEGWKHNLRNVWWIVDYNRQSLDSIVTDRLYGQFDKLFTSMGWRVVVLKYGKKLQRAFARPGGDALRTWIDTCENMLYSALVFQGGKAWREQIMKDIGHLPGVEDLLGSYDDEQLAALMTNLGGHDMEMLLEAFHAIEDDQPTCFLAYTIKGYNLPFAGHKDNHAGIMNADQMEGFQETNSIPKGREWDMFAGLPIAPDTLREFLRAVPFGSQGTRRYKGDTLEIPNPFPVSPGEVQSTQEGFGHILAELAKGESGLAHRIVTTSPDVSVSTNLGGWVNRRGIFNRVAHKDIFQELKVLSTQKWDISRRGQHIELGIAENNLFILLAAMGLSHSLFDRRLLPIGTLYDPFIARGLDALNYACYQDTRFIVVGTPSGITLAPEGGAHQSLATPLIGMAQDGLAAFEPTFVDELSAIMEWAFAYIQRESGEGSGDGEAGVDWLRDTRGGSVYLRLSTNRIHQPARRLSPANKRDIIKGGYWLHPPQEGADFALVYTGVIGVEVLAAFDAMKDDMPKMGVLAVTSADRLHAEWSAGTVLSHGSREDRGRSHIENLLSKVSPQAKLLSAIDGHPAALAWMGSVYGHKMSALGVEHFGQSGDIPDLYQAYEIDCDAILDATANLLLAP